MDGMYYCKGCDTEKPLSAFTIRADTGRPTTLCKSCRAQVKRNKAAEHGTRVPGVPEHSEHAAEHHAEIMNELRAIRAENAELHAEITELRAEMAALRKGIKHAPISTGEAPILTAPVEPTANDRVKSKLLGLNFEQAFLDADKKGN